MINFCEGVERDTLIPYLDPIVEQPLDGLCEKCREVLREEAKVGRAVVWNRLPEMFGLGSWDDLARSGNDA